MIRQFFKFENPTFVQTPATIIEPTVMYPCFYFRNDHTDSCYCRNWKMTPDPALFLLIIDSGSGSGSERKTPNPAGVDSGYPDPVPPLQHTHCAGSNVQPSGWPRAGVATSDVSTSDLMFLEKFLMSDILTTNLMLTEMFFLPHFISF